MCVIGDFLNKSGYILRVQFLAATDTVMYPNACAYVYLLS